jgi:hypothetical protein
MKTLVTVFIISLCSIDFLFGAGLVKDNPTNSQVAKSTGLEAQYDFSISFGISNSDLPESIVVTLKGKSDSIILNNLLFHFMASNGSYWAYNDDFRYLEIPLIISKDSTFCKEFRLDKLQFKPMKTKENVSFNTFKLAMLSNSVFTVLATMTDMSKAKNPYESNLFGRSNVIEYTPAQNHK